MDIKVNTIKTCTQRIMFDKNARMQDMKWKLCGKPASAFVVISFFGNSTKFQMCEEHKALIMDLTNIAHQQDLFKDAGVPDFVIQNTIRKELELILLGK